MGSSLSFLVFSMSLAVSNCPEFKPFGVNESDDLGSPVGAVGWQILLFLPVDVLVVVPFERESP